MADGTAWTEVAKSYPSGALLAASSPGKVFHLYPPPAPSALAKTALRASLGSGVPASVNARERTRVLGHLGVDTFLQTKAA